MVDDARERLDAAVRAAGEGDEEAFSKLYRAMQPLLLRYLAALVGPDCEDVAAEAWLQIARDLTTFRGDWDAFRGWTVTIARHRAVDLLRYQRRRPAVSAPSDELAGVASGGDTAVCALDGVATDEAISLIRTLPRDQAEAILLRVLIGLDAKSAGVVLGKRAGAVRTAAYRGLRELAKRLAKTAQPTQQTPQPASPVTSQRPAALEEMR